MRFAELFNIQRGPADDWFDPILEVDTDLFVDPFLIFKDADVFWRPAHGELVAHFNRCFRLIAQGNLNPLSLQYRKAVDLLTFPEPSELCLGYTASGTRGAGSGQGFAEVVAEAITASIRRGITDLRHFEELGILGEGIGADRISDMTCTILKPRLIVYTQEIVDRHGSPTDGHRLRQGGFDDLRLRWTDPDVRLPTNPSTRTPILLVPSRFLARLPRLNAEAWWQDYQNERLRTDLNYEILRRVDKATIVSTAREHPEHVREWVSRMEGEPATPYDLARDPLGRYAWHDAASAFVTQFPLQLLPPTDEASFLGLIEHVIAQFKLFVEEQGGWRLLWDLQEEKPEDAAQLLFYGIAVNYCKANNIVLDREVDFGRGPVDFKFSNGYVARAHLEVKKLHNTRFWDGLSQQLPSYMRSDDVKHAWFLAIRYREGKPDDDRASLLAERAHVAGAAHGRDIRQALVDARRKPSASQLRG